MPDPEGSTGWDGQPGRASLGWKLGLVLAAAGAALFLLWWRLSDAFFAGNARSILWVDGLVLGLGAVLVLAVGRWGKPRWKATGALAAGVALMGTVSLAVPLGLVPAWACCLDLDQEPRPADWQSGAALVAFKGSKSHHADESYTLAATGGEPLATPARCVAYQEGRHHRLDKCTVVPGNVSGWGDATWGPWTVQASWNGWGERLHEDVELHPERRTVVAFDAAGNPIAWWAGERAANGLFSTE